MNSLDYIANVKLKVCSVLIYQFYLSDDGFRQNTKQKFNLTVFMLPNGGWNKSEIKVKEKE